jgi:hypothetical protein
VVWEAALGRRVVLIEDRLWVNAREKARAMLGGEPEYVQSMGGDPPYIGVLPPVELWVLPWISAVRPRHFWGALDFPG